MCDDVRRAWQAANLATGDNCDRDGCAVYRNFTERVLAAHRPRSGSAEISRWCSCGALASACGIRAIGRDFGLVDPHRRP